ncbi:MAG: DNA repair protein RadC, partial [Shewanella sp.]
MGIKDWPEGEGPRDKLIKFGVAQLSDAEILAVLLRNGSRGLSAVELAMN